MYYITVSDSLNGRFAIKEKTIKKALLTARFHINKDAKEVAVYKEPFHTTTDKKALVCFSGRGSYWDNVSKEDKSIEAKRFK